MTVKFGQRKLSTLGAPDAVQLLDSGGSLLGQLITNPGTDNLLDVNSLVVAARVEVSPAQGVWDRWRSGALVDGLANGNPAVSGMLYTGTGGIGWDRARDATAANMGAQSGIGAAMVSPPGFWAVSSAPAAGVQASAVKAAGAAGVRHIATAVDYGYGATAALAAAAQRLLNLRDGASGLGTILLQLSFPVPAAVIPAVNGAAQERAYPGTAATAQTAEFDALQANLFESVAISGFDTPAY